MQQALLSPAQAGLPEIVPDLIGAAGAVVMLLMTVAIAALVYRHLTGGVEWPTEEPDEEGLRRGEADDEWDYY